MSQPRPFLHIPYSRWLWITFLLPTVSLFSCVVLSLTLHFDSVTSTHCKVPNVIPSISAAIGGNTPERYIWRFGMAFFSFPRMFEGFLIYNILSQSPTNSQVWYQLLNKAILGLHIIQYLSLFTLSYVSSKENFILHRNGFISFIICSLLHMFIFLIVFKHWKNPPTSMAIFSFKLRVGFAVSHVLFFILSIYVYWRHNAYCEAYMYSWYGLLEYLVVLTNIGFHTVAALELKDTYLTIAPLQRVNYD